MICREHLSQLRQEEQALEALAIQVVVVTFQGGAVVRAYAEETNLRWPILVDQSRLLYRAYGMERGSDSPRANARAIVDGHGNILVLMTHNTDFGDSFEREADDPQYFLHNSVPGYAFGVNALLYAMTH